MEYNVYYTYVHMELCNYVTIIIEGALLFHIPTCFVVNTFKSIHQSILTTMCLIILKQIEDLWNITEI